MANKKDLILDKHTTKRIINSFYLGERCVICGIKFETQEDLKDTVYAGYHDKGRLAHRTCWDEQHGDPGGHGD